MRFRTDFLVLPALVHAVEKGWLTLEEALSATIIPIKPNYEARDQLSFYAKLCVRLYDRQLLTNQRWHELQPKILTYLDDAYLWQVEKFSPLPLFLKHVELENLCNVFEKLLQYGHVIQGKKWFQQLAPRLNSMLWQELWGFIQQLPNQPNPQRSKAYILISSSIPQEFVSILFAETLALPHQIGVDPLPFIISELAHRLNPTEFQQAWDYIYSLYFTPTGNIADALTALLRQLSTAQRIAAIEPLLLKNGSENWHFREMVYAVGAWLSHRDWLALVLEQILTHTHNDRQFFYLVALFPSMERAEREFFTAYLFKEMSVIEGFKADQLKYVVINELAPYLAEQTEGILTAYHWIQQKHRKPLKHDYYRAIALGRLAEFAIEPLRQDLLDKALQAALCWSYESTLYPGDGKQSAVFDLLPQFDQKHLNTLFDILIEKPNSEVPFSADRQTSLNLEHSVIFTEMFPHLNDDQIRRILARMQEGAE